MHITDAVRIVAHHLDITQKEAANWLLVKRAPKKLVCVLQLGVSGNEVIEFDAQIGSIELARAVLMEIANEKQARIAAMKDTNEDTPHREQACWEEKEFMDFLAQESGQALSTASNLSWPWGNHSTSKLDHLAAAANEFWLDYQPDNPRSAPKNEVIVNWLIARGASSNTAMAIASILRPDNLPTGPRKKVVPTHKS